MGDLHDCLHGHYLPLGFGHHPLPGSGGLPEPAEPANSTSSRYRPLEAIETVVINEPSHSFASRARGCASHSVPTGGRSPAPGECHVALKNAVEKKP